VQNAAPELVMREIDDIAGHTAAAAD
jgi:hypothetical protein